MKNNEHDHPCVDCNPIIQKKCPNVIAETGQPICNLVENEEEALSSIKLEEQIYAKD
jgi:hypothetical protein